MATDVYKWQTSLSNQLDVSNEVRDVEVSRQQMIDRLSSDEATRWSEPSSDGATVNAVLILIALTLYTLFLSSLVWYHVFLIVKNRSTLEQMRPPLLPNGCGKFAYNLGPLMNIKQVFGLNMVYWPFPVYSTLGDGVTFASQMFSSPPGKGSSIPNIGLTERGDEVSPLIVDVKTGQADAEEEEEEEAPLVTSCAKEDVSFVVDGITSSVVRQSRSYCLEPSSCAAKVVTTQNHQPHSAASGVMDVENGLIKSENGAFLSSHHLQSLQVCASADVPSEVRSGPEDVGENRPSGASKTVYRVKLPFADDKSEDQISMLTEEGVGKTKAAVSINRLMHPSHSAPLDVVVRLDTKNNGVNTASQISESETPV